MKIVRSPYRVSLFGGSTDYECYFREHGSLLVGFAMDKYSYIYIKETNPIMPYLTKFIGADVQMVDCNSDIDNRAVRGVIDCLSIKDGYEIAHMSDLPSQTGIGSSSSFICSLLMAFGVKDKTLLANSCNYIERVVLNEDGGVQDPIWAAFGGFNSIEIDKNGLFRVKPLPITSSFISHFLEHSCLIYTGSNRQSYKIAKSHKGSIDVKKKIHDLARVGYERFCQESLFDIGHTLDMSWIVKKQISGLVSTPEVDKLYDSLKEDGMIGGKLLGTGGSGFIFGVFTEPTDSIKDKYGSRYIDCECDFDGTKVVYE